MDIPGEFHDLLTGRAVALVGTIGKQGEPNVTPSWFLWEADQVRISLVEGRQRLRNLRRDPRIALTIVEPTRPTRYVELRGRVVLRPDPELRIEKAVAEKYTGTWHDVEPAGRQRWAADVVVEHITSQPGFDQAG